MKADSLVGIVAVIVIPVEQGTRCLRRQRECMHAQGSANIDLACGGKQIVTHHAHDGAGHDAEVLFHRSPALHSADPDVSLLHPVIDHISELRHLD